MSAEVIVQISANYILTIGTAIISPRTLCVLPYGVLLMVTIAQEYEIGSPCTCLDCLQRTD